MGRRCPYQGLTKTPIRPDRDEYNGWAQGKEVDFFADETNVNDPDFGTDWQQSQWALWSDLL